MNFARGLGATVLAVVAVLAAAPAAFAGRVSYAVPSGPDYTVTAEGHGNGIVKVTYTRCLQVGGTVVLPLRVSSRGPTHAGPISATWKVMKNGGATLAFNPDPIAFTDGSAPPATLSITPDRAPAPRGVYLRFKVDPANGSGLGQGPGVMVRVACVLAAAPNRTPGPCPSATPSSPPAGDSPADHDQGGGNNVNGNNGGGNDRNGNNGGPNQGAAPGTNPAATCAPAPAVAGSSLAAPTAATFPAIGSAQARGPARCVSTPRTFRAHAGERSVLRVIVHANGQRLTGSTVRVTTPSGVIVKRTDRHGVAVFTIAPRRTGRIVVQSDACFGAQRLAVLGRRVSGRLGVRPRFTG